MPDDDQVPPSERPTPRETGPHERAQMFRILAEGLALKLDRAAYEAAKVGTTDIRRGVEARRLAGRARALVEGFKAWERGEATFEQRAGDHAAWLTLQAEAREFGVR